MRRDGRFRIPAPLTAIESARRTAALKANQGSDCPLAAAMSSEIRDEAVGVDETGVTERTDDFLFGPRTAQLLRDCTRDVALASRDAKQIVFQEIAKRMGEAVAGQWLSKTAMIDRLVDIAGRHGSFGLKQDEIEQLIADAAEAIRVTPVAPASAPLKRRPDHPPG